MPACFYEYSLTASSTPHSRRTFSSVSFQMHHFLLSRPWFIYHPYFLQSELIEGCRENPLIFPKEKTRGGVNTLNFVFYYLFQFCKYFGFALVNNTLRYAYNLKPTSLSEISLEKIACINACLMSINPSITDMPLCYHFSSSFFILSIPIWAV